MHGVTKAALNALTIRLSKEHPSPIKVNAMCHGWFRTRMGGHAVTRKPDQGADTPSGSARCWTTVHQWVFRDRQPIEW